MDVSTSVFVVFGSWLKNHYRGVKSTCATNDLAILNQYAAENVPESNFNTHTLVKYFVNCDRLVIYLSNMV